MMRLVLAFLCVVAPAAAQEFPAQFSVDGVASDDVLNVRAAPDAGSEIRDTIGPYEIDIEVLGLNADGTWGRVPLPEGVGWVSMRYLAANADTDAEAVPRPLICSGTEPFWTLANYPRGPEFRDLSLDRRADLELLYERRLPDGYLLRYTGGEELPHTLLVEREWCSDGMSDREFGFSATILTGENYRMRTLHGCCSLTAR